MRNDGFERYNAALAHLLEAIEGADFSRQLSRLFAALVDFDDCIVLCFRPSAPPDILHATPSEASGRDYAAGPYLLDPFYEAYREGKRGCFRFRDLAPDQSRLAEDFLAHYRRYDVGDEIGLLLSLGKGRGGHVSLSRRRGRPPFTRQDAQWLSPVAAPIEKLWRWREARAQKSPDVGDRRSHDRLNRALDNFGRSILTEREVEVTHWLLRGFPAKAIARQLRISPGTTRNHLKNIYPKLGVGSHAELFGLFFRAIQAGPGAEDGDPLRNLDRPIPKRL